MGDSDSGGQQPEAPDYLVANLIDTFVNGVTYTTSSGLTGLTGDQGNPGSFAYRTGDTVTFSVGDVTVAQFSADVIENGLLFLQDIVGTELSDSNTNYLENMAIFLQALDDDLQDSTPNDGILQTDDLQNTSDSYATNINIAQAVRDALTGYIDPTTGEPLNLATAGKEMLSLVLSSLGIEFTRESELDSSGQGENVFESQAMEHVADVIQQLAGDRAPESTDERLADSINVPGGTVRYNYSELDGEITFNTGDLLAGAVGQQVITQNLVVKNVQLSAAYQDIGTLEDRGNGNYAIVLKEGFDQYDLEGLTLDYRVEDWTAIKEVTSSTQDSYKSHLSADIDDVNEGDGFNQFTLKSELTFDTDSILNINFTSENLSAALGYQIAEYGDDYLVPIEYSNDGGVTWQVMEQTSIEYDEFGVPRPIFSFVMEAGNNAVEIRVPIFDDAKIESTEYFDAVVSGDNVYDEQLQFAITDNDSDGSNLPRINIDFVYAIEGQGDAVFTLTLSEPSNSPVTVDFSTADLAAKAGEDYIATSGTVTFAPGETTATISVPIIDDLIVESNPNPEMALVNLSNPSGAVLVDSQGTLRIFDNDGVDNTNVGITLDPVTDDNIISAAEESSTITLTGTVNANGLSTGIVIVTVNGINYQTTMNSSDGSFSVDVPGSELTADADTTVEAVVYAFGENGAQGSATDSQSYTINLDGISPVTDSDSADNAVNENALNGTEVRITGLATDPDTSDSVSYSLSDNYNGAFTIDPVSGVVTVADGSKLDYETDSTPTIEITATSTDGSSSKATFTIELSNENDNPPTASPVRPPAIEEDSGPHVIDQSKLLAAANDVDGDGLEAVNLQITSGNGTLDDNGDGTWTYTPALNDDTEVVFSYDVTDGSHTVTGVTATLDITPVNDDPVLTVSNLSAIEDGVSVSGTPSFTDVDTGDTHTYSVSTLGAGQGSVSINPTTGEYTYSVGSDFQSLAAGEETTVSFDVTVTDREGGSDTEIVTVTITGTNDGAVIGGDAVGAVTEDADDPTLSDTGTLSISDDDAGEAIFQTEPSSITASAGALGSLSITSAGVWTYTVANADVQYLGEGDTKEETFTVLSADGTAHDIVVTITGTNDGAVIGGDAVGAVTEDADDPTLSDTGTLSISDDDA
ncbi:VCBS domain-containing protein, partial [Aestuariicella sp. G3-2]|uniref:VCBS domain-containing protein n=1 Tax=Pseudomaricurvus albidus TaxID=2842452 RepID=UPI001C0E4262